MMNRYKDKILDQISLLRILISQLRYDYHDLAVPSDKDFYLGKISAYSAVLEYLENMIVE